MTLDEFRIVTGAQLPNTPERLNPNSFAFGTQLLAWSPEAPMVIDLTYSGTKEKLVCTIIAVQNSR